LKSRVLQADSIVTNKVTIKNCKFTLNKAIYGGALFI